MDGLILFSHGSVLCGAGEMLREHAARLRVRGAWAAVEVGFMNYSRPTFAEAVERMAAAGVERVVVAPYFLVPGKFVTSDLPKHLAAARQARPGLEFVTADCIGYHPALADALLELAAEARPPAAWRDDLRRAAAFCEARSDCPLFGKPDCPGIPGVASRKAQVAGENDGQPTTDHGGSVPQPSTLNPQPTALLILVHGSPRPAANAPMYRVVEDARARGVYTSVEVGFLECNAPDIPTAIAACVERGAREVVAVPYFLHTGSHVADDLPGFLEGAQARYPDVAFRLADFLGHSPRLTDILAERAEEGRKG